MSYIVLYRPIHLPEGSYILPSFNLGPANLPPAQPSGPNKWRATKGYVAARIQATFRMERNWMWRFRLKTMKLRSSPQKTPLTRKASRSVWACLRTRTACVALDARSRSSTCTPHFTRKSYRGRAGPWLSANAVIWYYLQHDGVHRSNSYIILC